MGLLKLLSPGGLLVKAQSTSMAQMPERTAKSWTVDPYSYIESLTHKDRPATLSYDQLRIMANRCSVIAAIIQTRTTQVAEFAQSQPDKYSLGYTVAMRDGSKPGSRAAMAQINQLIQEIGHCGVPGTAADNFENFLKKITRDSLIYDQVAIEVVPRNNGMPAFFEAVDAATIRIAADPPSPVDQRGEKITDLVPQTPFQQAMAAYQRDLMVPTRDGEQPAKYVQVINGTVRTRYAQDELWFGVRNPRSDLNVQGYGLSELETLIGTVTSYLFAEEYNKKMFTQGSMPKGVLNLKGEIDDEMMENFKREWRILVSGVNNAWRTPVINAEDVEYVNLQATNKDMEYMQWIQFLVRIASACYLIDPAEINFDMPRGLDSSSPMIESGNEAKLRASRDRGLHPLLRFIQRAINEIYVYRIDPDFEFRFVGLNAKTVEQQQTIIQTAVTTYKTLNEVRAGEDLPPVNGGDIVLNPIYAQVILAAQQAEQQAEMQEQQMEAEQDQLDQQHDHEKDLAQTKAKAQVASAKKQAPKKAA